MIQMTCPYCKREYPWDNGKTDADIAKVQSRITAIHKRLVELKAMPYMPDANKERRKLGLELSQLNETSNKLKLTRKLLDQQRHRQEYGIFKELVRDLIGEEEYMKLIEKMEEEMQAYNISEMMKHSYTRSNNLKSVTSINKL